MASLRIILGKQSVRFLCVGLINTLVSFGCFNLFLLLGFHYVFAGFVALAIGVVFSFFSSGGLVFGKLGRWQFVRYLIAWSILYLAYIFVVFLAKKFGGSEFFGGLLATILITPLSFVVQKFIVFR